MSCSLLTGCLRDSAHRSGSCMIACFDLMVALQQQKLPASHASLTWHQGGTLSLLMSNAAACGPPAATAPSAGHISHHARQHCAYQPHMASAQV